MNKDDIIRMAREAGFAEYEVEDYTPSGYDIRYWRFATLVAAHEREEFAKHAVEIARKAVNHEREACAKVCSDLHLEGEDDTGLAADLIIARGNT